MTLGEKLQQQLDEANVSQITLATKTGLSTKHVNRLVKDRCRLSVEVAVRIEMAVPSISAEGLLIDQLRQEIADYVKGFSSERRNAAGS